MYIHVLYIRQLSAHNFFPARPLPSLLATERVTETTRVLETSDHEAMVLKQQFGADGGRNLGFGPSGCVPKVRPNAPAFLPGWKAGFYKYVPGTYADVEYFSFPASIRLFDCTVRVLSQVDRVCNYIN